MKVHILHFVSSFLTAVHHSYALAMAHLWEDGLELQQPSGYGVSACCQLRQLLWWRLDQPGGQIGQQV